MNPKKATKICLGCTPSSQSPLNRSFGSQQKRFKYISSRSSRLSGEKAGWGGTIRHSLFAIRHFRTTTITGIAARRQRDRPTEGATYAYRIEFKDVKRVVSIRTDIFAYAQGLAGTVPWGVLPAWLITFFIAAKGFELEEATVILLMFGIGVAIGFIYGGFLGDYVDKRFTNGRVWLCACTILAGVPVTLALVAWQVPSKPGFEDALVTGIIGLVGVSIVAVAGPNIQAIICGVNLPEHRGTAFSVFNLTDKIGQGAGPALGGALIGAFGHTTAMNIAILFWIPCGLLWFPLLRHRQRDISQMHEILESHARELEAGVGSRE